MRCSNCGVETSSSARFCGNCGSAMLLSCNACGALVETGQRFCEQCGAPVSSAVTNAQPEFETPNRHPRALLSLSGDWSLFCSPTSSGLRVSRRAETPKRFVTSSCASRRYVGSVIERYGGFVDNFIGDAVFAVWGSPRSRTKTTPSERFVVDWNSSTRSPPSARSQCPWTRGTRRRHHGRGRRSTVGTTGERMVAGDLVNTASRLQNVAEPRTVLVGEATYHVIESRHRVHRSR